MRKNRAPKREVLADPMYNSIVVTRLINRVMLDGKRGVASQIVYGAFKQIEEATGNNPLEVFETAMENIMPVLEVRARRVGGSNYQVPVEVRPERRTTLGLRWLVTIARNRGEHTMQDRLAKEILDAANNTGAAVKKNVKILTKWLKLTVRSLTSAGKIYLRCSCFVRRTLAYSSTLRNLLSRFCLANKFYDQS